MLPELPRTYYLDNVQTLFAHVGRVYADILDPDMLAFLDDFARLEADARKLCIRLLNRRHERFRRGKLDYPEIADLDAALDALAAADFVELDGEIDAAELLSLFTRAELLAAHGDDADLKKLRRPQLEAVLLDAADADYFQRLRTDERLIQLLRGDQYLRCQMLFFGNLNQSMTDFVLRDLGLYQYESYTIDAEHRPYRDAVEIEQHWLTYLAESLFELIDRQDPAALLELCAALPDDIEARAPAWRRGERLRYEIARQLERLGEFDSALDLYRQCQLPPSRERIARIFDRRGEHRQAFDICAQIATDPFDEAEMQFAASFASRLARRHGFDTPPLVDAINQQHQPEIIDLELEPRDSVELAVAAHLDARAAGERCFYLENHLFTGVLGLLIWDAVFAPLPGAFFNPFQYRPSDFYAHDFCDNRREQLQATWDSLRDNDDILRLVKSRWQQKHGLMNPLVNWQYLDLEVIELALERIDHAHWRAIFERILADLRNNRAGFPDLLHFPADGGYCLVEVKGPGDSLQKNQLRWMQYFARHGIAHRLARVTWRAS
ncbi:MAG TPA: VRR-NUC domain-containing protein [Gammaproteobacteria bacterium]|jgi:hypothetical protein